MLATVYGKPVEWFFGAEAEPAVAPNLPNDEESETPLESDTQGAHDYQDRVLAAIARLDEYIRAQAPALATAESRAAYGPTNPLDRSPVQVLEVASAAGAGAEVYDETPVGLLWFRNDWLQRHSIDPNQSQIISVRGESMEPTLPDGTSILVDRKRQELREGRVYVMRTEDGLVVKRVERNSQGWWLTSDNPAWVPAPLANDTDIIGEVRWAARTF